MKWALAGTFVFVSLGFSQSTQAIVTGHVLDAVTAKPLSGAKLTYERLGSAESGEAFVSGAGAYSLPPLSPGVYRLHVDAGTAYQPREAAAVEIPVAGLLVIDFTLRPLADLWEAGQYRSIFPSEGRTTVNFYGPDVDFSHTTSFVTPVKQEMRTDGSISTVISPREVDGLPFYGRDVYASIVLQPLVTSASTTARGLGISVNGQRFGEANYLLDGIENNGYLVTGPQLITPVEAVQEYRLSLANYSAEYGGTTGFIANAVTQAGGAGFHGMGYFYLMNDALNSNDVVARYQGLPRAPLKQIEAGLRAGASIVPKRLFVSGSMERLRSRGYLACKSYLVPGGGALALASGTAATLLSQYHPSGDTGCHPQFAVDASYCPLCTLIRIRPTDSLNRTTALTRVDYTATPRLRLFARAAGSGVSRPDYSFSPYPSFISGFDQNAVSGVIGAAYAGTAVAHEGRLGVLHERLGFQRAASMMPLLQSADGVALPTSGLNAGFAYSAGAVSGTYAFSYHAQSHFVKAGGGIFLRNLRSNLDAGEGTFSFANLNQFLSNTPVEFQVNIARLPALSGSEIVPNSARRYHYSRGFLFAEDSWHVTNHLVLNAGYRVDLQSSPANTGEVRDTLVAVPRAQTTADGIKEAVWASPPSGDQPLFPFSHWAAAVRTSAAYAVQGGRTVFRAGFGVFRDTVYDNLWINVQENQYVSASGTVAAVMGANYDQSSQAVIATFFGGPKTSTPCTLCADPSSYHVIVFDPDFHLPSWKSGFIALDQTISRNWRLQAMAVRGGSSDLITNDEVNRLRGSVRPNHSLPVVFYRSNSGSSDYRALAFRARYQTGALTLQASYTLALSHDNQSDPLAGDFDLLSTQTQGATAAPGEAAFTRELSPAVDYGHSDFDQRHNVVAYALWTPPGLLPATPLAALGRNWALAATSAIRSGTPYTAMAQVPSAFGEPYLNNRANLICATGYLEEKALTTGRQLLNPACFEKPTTGIGDTMRNQFYGPGAWNLDFSISRAFHVPRLAEAARLTVRADFYNVFNHANLGNPAANLNCTEQLAAEGFCPVAFGHAFFGRTDVASDFPAIKPFAETGRLVQLMLRFEF